MKVSRLSLPPQLRPRRWGWLIFLVLYAIILCRLRLFNLLAFEFSFACALPLSLIGARFGLDALNDGRSPLLAWLSAIKRGSLYGLAPLVPISLNAIWVRNCNWLDGFLFYTLISLVGLWVSAAWGVTLALFKRGLGSFILLLFGSLLYCLGVFYWTPLIDQFHPLLGYYPGSIYDEEISIGWRLLVSRAEDLAIATMALIWAAHRAGHTQPPLRRGGVTLLSLLMIICGISVGVHRGAWSVQRALGGIEESTHFRLYYPAQWSARRRDRMLAELEFNHQELSRFFGRAPEEKIEAYLYRSAREKKALIGAGRTLISKPWQRSIHVHGVKIGASVIRHEIAHAFSADWAPAPHHLSLTRWWIPHMPMIEGLAVAATWELGRLDPHLWSAATLKIGVAPPLSGLLSSERFYLYSSSLAYTLCGSFVRFYLEEERGAAGEELGPTSERRAALEALYRSGGESELELEAWLTRWEGFLKSQTLSPQALNWAQGRFGRRSVFYKVCAHEIAERRGTARRAEARGDWGKADRLWRSIERDAPGD
ncbi:MAG: hypothetical protein VYD19_04150, partial [Myxococcota bacterium]|nr:hypothetical protein [Myxococcota bacterium]